MQNLPAISDQLQNASKLIASGNKADATLIVRQVLKADPNNKIAWYQASFIADKPAEQIRYLKRALSIEPKYPEALERLSQITPLELIIPIPMISKLDDIKQAKTVKSVTIIPNILDVKTGEGGINLMCPKCLLNRIYSTEALHICPICITKFTSSIETMRAKRSHKKGSTREFNLRTIDQSGGEHHYSFITSTGDFELRSKDKVAITYVDRKLCVVENLTTREYLRVAWPTVKRVIAEPSTTKPLTLKQYISKGVAQLLGMFILFVLLVIVIGFLYLVISIFGGSTTCNDGSSSSASGSGACSHHGGVR